MSLRSATAAGAAMPNTLPKAIELVHRILSSSSSASTSAASAGFTTKEIVREAIALYQSENGLAGSSTAPAAAVGVGAGAAEHEGVVAAIKGKGKGKGKVSPAAAGPSKVKGVNVVPEGHPFISTSYLKHRVLPILQSQNLITKSVRPAAASPESSSSSSSASGQAQTSGRSTFIWRLATSRPSNLSTPAWDLPSHWDRLISGTSPGLLASEQAQNAQLRKEEEHQRSLDSGKVRRTHAEIAEWDQRIPGLTTKGERSNLNKRRGEARPKKERKRVEKYELLFGGVREEAEARLGGAQIA